MRERKLLLFVAFVVSRQASTAVRSGVRRTVPLRSFCRNAWKLRSENNEKNLIRAVALGLAGVRRSGLEQSS